MRENKGLLEGRVDMEERRAGWRKIFRQSLVIDWLCGTPGYG